MLTLEFYHEIYFTMQGIWLQNRFKTGHQAIDAIYNCTLLVTFSLEFYHEIPFTIQITTTEKNSRQDITDIDDIYNELY